MSAATESGCDVPKVLLLGISYPDVKGHMDEHGYSEKLLVHKKLSVDQAVELVRRGILTEMDARDLARCVATEQLVEGGLEAYTVSKEVGGVYRDDRHVYANFNNSRGLYNALTQNFGPLQFQQVILDYYWMPTGWLVTRWAKSLFQQTLPDLVRYNMLAFPDESYTQQRDENDANENNISQTPTSSTPGTPDESTDVELSSDMITEGGDESFHKQVIPSIGSDSCINNHVDNRIELEKGVVFLPFCAHVCKELVGGIHILKKYYAITFVHKKELPGHALWKGTMKIDANIMQHRLGKRLDQEEIYCTFQPQDIYASMEDSHIQKDDVMKMLLSIENFKEIRMIRLRPLRQHNPDLASCDSDVTPEVGGFIGLNWAMGKRLFKEFRSRKKAPPPRQPALKPRRRKVSDFDVDSESSQSSSDDDSSIGGDDAMFDDHYVDIDFDPCDPENIAETTHFFPYPTLDLVSYIDGKDIMNDDRVMDSWAETWGTKISRKKNRKQDILQSGFQELQRQKKGYLSSHPDLHDLGGEESNGYTWTLSEGGWVRTLNGDDPEWNLMPKIVKIAKTDHAMTACRQLFEMKNPGYKTLSRSYGYNPQLSCYQIPKSSVMAKITCAKDFDVALMEKTRKADAAKRAAAENLLELGGSSQDEEIEKFPTIPLEEMSSNMIKKFDSKSLTEHLKRYGQTEIPAGRKAKREMLVGLVQRHEKELERLLLLNAAAQDLETLTASSTLDRFADVAFEHFKLRTEDPLPTLAKDDDRNRTDFATKLKEYVVQEELPSFKPLLTHVAYDLSGSDHFPRELYRLVQDAEPMVMTHIISWQEKGKSFIVHDVESFEKNILMECTGDEESTYGDFVENLKNFGFVEIKDGRRKGGYRHEFFRRKRPEDVALISRVDSDSSDDQDSVTVPDTSAKSKSGKAPRGKKTSFRSPRKNSALASSNIDTAKKGDFFKELHSLLEDAHGEGVVDFFSWLPGGKSFGISDDDMFVKNVLKKFCGTTKMSSFEASLFNFGFKKSRKAGGNRRYEHPSFLQGRPEKLSGIKPRSKQKLDAKTLKLSRRRKVSEPKRTPKTNRQHSASKAMQLDASASVSLMTPKPQVSPHQRMSDVTESLRLLLDENHDSTVVNWLPDGSAFAVAKPDQFETEIMPKYFHHVSYPSLRRELKAQGFDSAGSSGELKGIMFHGLFQRDYPELWKLQDDDELNEKVLYCLSHDKALLQNITGSDSCLGNSRETKEMLRWRELPAVQEFLYDSVASHFSVLCANRTKLQSELLGKMAKTVLGIADTRGYSLESMDETQIVASLRVFYRLHFQSVRKHLQSMKSDAESGDAKATLRSLILKASAIDLDNITATQSSLEAIEVPVSTKQCDRPPSRSRQETSVLKEDVFSSVATAARDENICSERSSSDTSRSGRDAADPVSKANASKKRKAGNPGVKSKRARIHEEKQPKKKTHSKEQRKRDVLPSRSSISNTQPSMMGIYNPAIPPLDTMNHGAANHRGSEQGIAAPKADFLGQITNGIVHQAVLALDDPHLERNDLLRQNQIGRDANQASISSNSIKCKLIQTFPFKALGAYLNLNLNQLDSSGDEIEVMNRIVFPGVDLPHATLLQERLIRLHVYIKLLQSNEGYLWPAVLGNTPSHLQADYICGKLMECFINERFQSLIIQHESHEDALFWSHRYGDILRRMKDEISSQHSNRHSATNSNPLDSRHSHLLQQNHASIEQSPQILLRQALLQQQQQQQQLNDLRNLSSAEQMQLLNLANGPRGSAVATPSPPIESLAVNENSGRTNLLAALAAATVLNSNVAGRNGIYNP